MARKGWSCQLLIGLPQTCFKIFHLHADEFAVGGDDKKACLTSDSVVSSFKFSKSYLFLGLEIRVLI